MQHPHPPTTTKHTPSHSLNRRWPMVWQMKPWLHMPPPPHLWLFKRWVVSTGLPVNMALWHKVPLMRPPPPPHPPHTIHSSALQEVSVGLPVSLALTLAQEALVAHSPDEPLTLGAQRWHVEMLQVELVALHRLQNHTVVSLVNYLLYKTPAECRITHVIIQIPHNAFRGLGGGGFHR